ncbi:glycosyltransferase family 2 protein [bacterium]|nr:glycosyltransferase family 2 protein [candidate division CSSED10-310 bacterium]
MPQNRLQDISVIVVSYNAHDHLNVLIPHLIEMRRELAIEIIVVDNASSDESVRFLREIETEIVLRVNSENAGFARAVNQAISVSQGSFILLINPDARIESGVIEELHAFLMGNPRVAAAAPRLLYPDGRMQSSRGTFPGMIVISTHLLGLKKLMPRDETVFSGPLRILGGFFKQYAKPEPVQTVDYTTGACVLLRKDVLEELGGFDEQFFLYYEEIDLGFRMQKAGYRWVYLDGIQAIHEVAASSRRAPLRPYFERYRSMVLYFRKHHPGWRTVLVLYLTALSALFRLALRGSIRMFRIDPGGSWRSEKEMLKRLVRLRREI